ncbi:inositol-3-phosphate synthase [Streptococcus oralis]|uniref:inositol-3-phosphate synthase n=1 Tax=Streptococcus oralis TaxID=1303 RepID=UPI002284B580|nr:inositol-3-phosphate synthase [Streptococcus oralis]MCY7079203.1 inositol-3-phosphate synthase [Streptococcus oralis]
MDKVKVAIAGVGCCASSLVQLVYYSRGNNKNGIMFDKIGKYSPSDIEFCLGFDVTDEKIGLDLSEAIFSYPNVAEMHTEVPFLDAEVLPGVCNDGLQGYLSEKITLSDKCKNIDKQYIVDKLIEKECDVLICYLPSGSTIDARLYAEAALEAKVAFVNCIPEFIARDQRLQKEFELAGVPLLGDDMRSHMGATTIHTALIELFQSRGISVDNTYQLNFGGNMDFYNLSDSSRNKSKQSSKKNALNSAGIDASNVTAGPNGYVDYLNDTKICYLRIEGTSILGSSINVELRLDVEDSPNSAGVVITAVRIAKVAKEKSISQQKVNEAMACLFKSPYVGKTESESLKLIRDFVDETKE